MIGGLQFSYTTVEHRTCTQKAPDSIIRNTHEMNLLTDGSKDEIRASDTLMGKLEKYSEVL